MYTKTHVHWKDVNGIIQQDTANPLSHQLMASPYKPSCKQAFAPETKKLALKDPQQQLHRPNKTTNKQM